MSVITRFGYYYLNVNVTIPVGNKVMRYRQKIHSNHPNFDKIDPKYFVSYLQHETYIPMGERGLFIDFDPQYDIPEIPIITIEAPKESIIEEIVSPTEEPKPEEAIEPVTTIEVPNETVEIKFKPLEKVIEEVVKEETVKKTRTKKKESKVNEQPKDPKSN